MFIMVWLSVQGHQERSYDTTQGPKKKELNWKETEIDTVYKYIDVFGIRKYAKERKSSRLCKIVIRNQECWNAGVVDLCIKPPHCPHKWLRVQRDLRNLEGGQKKKISAPAAMTTSSNLQRVLCVQIYVRRCVCFVCLDKPGPKTMSAHQRSFFSEKGLTARSWRLN